MRQTSWIAVVVLPLAGCVAVLDFDVVDDAPGAGGSTNATNAATGSTATGGQGGAGTSSGASQGGGGEGAGGPSCDGCVEDGVCLAGTTIEACGTDGATCESCSSDEECSVAACVAEGCDRVAFDDGTPCVGGRCEGGTCVPGAEDCTNGEDDDANGLIDCADGPACGDLATCIPPVDVGWLGPFAAYEAVGEISCPGVWPEALGTTLHRDVDDTAFDCGQCTCDSACSIYLSEYTDAGCTEVYDGFPVTQGECLSSLLPPEVRSAQIDPAGVTCADDEVGRNTTKAVWKTTVTLCGAADLGAGCGDDGCASLPPLLGDDVHVCIAKEGDAACPTTGYTVDRRAYAADAPLDDRACSDCSCVAPPDGTCGGGIRTFTNAQCDQCGGSPSPCNIIDLGCIDLSDAVGIGYAEYVPDRQCTPQGGESSGSARPSQPWTICCLD